MKLNNIMIFSNGMVCTFDDQGEQVGSLQGEFNQELYNKLLEASDNYTLWTFPGDSVEKFTIVKDLEGFDQVARHHLVTEKEISPGAVLKLVAWLGDHGVRYFRHLKGLTGTVSPVLRLNFRRKLLPAHPVHFREGMAVRNFLRSLDELKDWNHADFENKWKEAIEEAIKPGVYENHQATI